MEGAKISTISRATIPYHVVCAYCSYVVVFVSHFK